MNWYKGPPPSVGWWPASTLATEWVYRWWNGEYWSKPALRSLPAEEAGFIAAIPSSVGTETIRWSPRPMSWPARSRT